ncbi:MAG TPA: hypothetical protein VGB63_08080 [Pedobacter sp.]
MHHKILISQRHLNYALAGVLFFNLFFLAGSCIANIGYLPSQAYLKHILYLVDLGAENNLAAWYSSMLLFLCGVMSLVCFAMDSQHLKDPSYTKFGWIIFSSIFTLLSFDELGSVHENISESLLFKGSGKAVLGNESSGWIMFMALVGLVSLFMISFSILKFKSNLKALCFFSLGILLYLSNPFQENFEIAAHQASADPLTWKRPVLFLFLEEGSEIFGSLCFLMAVTLYALKISQTDKTSSSLKINFQPFIMFRFTSFVIILSSIGLLLTQYIFGNVTPQSQVGVPKNWFTAMLSFLIFLYSLNAIISMPLRFHKPLKVILIITCLLGLGFSLLYGSNLYAYPFIPHSNAALGKDLVSGLICLISLIPSFFLFIWGKNGEVKTGAFLWSMICIALFSTPAFSAELAFVALCCLLYTLTIYPSLLNEFDPKPYKGITFGLKSS